MARLIVNNRDIKFTVNLGDEPVVIGRDEEQADVHIIESESSRRHAQIERMSDGRFKVVDLESSNGTVVNGKPSNAALLGDGDVITIGKTTLTFRSDPPDLESEEHDDRGAPDERARAGSQPPARPPGRKRAGKGRGQRGGRGRKAEDSGSPMGIVLAVCIGLAILGAVAYGLATAGGGGIDRRAKRTDDPDLEAWHASDVKKKAPPGQLNAEQIRRKMKIFTNTWAQADDQAFLAENSSRTPEKIRKSALSRARSTIRNNGWPPSIREQIKEFQALIREKCKAVGMEIPPEAQEGYVPRKPKGRK